MAEHPVFVVHEHPIVDSGPAEYEPPISHEVTFEPAAIEPIPALEQTHPVVDSGPTESESAPSRAWVTVSAPAEPLPVIEQKHPIVD